MKVLTYRSYKDHLELYTEIHHPISENNYHIELARKGKILLLNAAVMLYKAGLCTGVKNWHAKFTLVEATDSIDDFDTKAQVAKVLQQRQDWEVPQVKDLKLVIPEHYTFMASYSFFATLFIAVGIPAMHLEKTTRIKSTYETSLDTSPPHHYQYHYQIIIIIL